MVQAMEMQVFYVVETEFVNIIQWISRVCDKESVKYEIELLIK
jgi:hypothetical protein